MTPAEIKARLNELPVAKIVALCQHWEQRQIHTDNGGSMLLICRTGVGFAAAGSWPENLLNAMALAIAAGEMEL